MLKPSRDLTEYKEIPGHMPGWVLERALLEHGWKHSVSDGSWFRRSVRLGSLEEKIEFYDKDKCYPFYPETQRRIWREYCRETGRKP